MTIVLAVLVILILGLAALALWRQRDRFEDEHAAAALVTLAQAPEARFSPAMVAALPEPAQRYFRFTIADGAPLITAVEIEMAGEIGLGTKDAPNERPFTAQQVLAPPHGLVWRVQAGLLAGSDGVTPLTSWTRFWLAGVIPVVRAGGPDHHRSAFGRVVAEAAIWAPASLLPGDDVQWEPVDADTARAVVTGEPHSQSVAITVDAAGQPTRVVIQRWSNANPDRAWREQPFGGTLADFREVDGYRLPFRVEGGNLIGTPDYFPFYKARIERIGLIAAA